MGHKLGETLPKEAHEWTETSHDIDCFTGSPKGSIGATNCLVRKVDTASHLEALSENLIPDKSHLHRANSLLVAETDPRKGVKVMV